jgi:hypothetical protein
MLQFVVLIALLPALFGVWLIIDFLLWEIRGHIATAQIKEFSADKDKGKLLPVMSFEHEKIMVSIQAERIDQLMYLLSKPKAGDVTDVIYIVEETGLRVRIYGYMNIVAGVMLVVPFVAALALWMGKALAVTQSLFFFLFAGIMAVTIIFMKIVQRIY